MQFSMGKNDLLDNRERVYQAPTHSVSNQSGPLPPSCRTRAYNAQKGIQNGSDAFLSLYSRFLFSKVDPAGCKLETCAQAR